MSYKILSVEAQNFLDLCAIKNYLRISHDYDDLWITELIGASISAAESFLRKKLLKSKVQVKVKYSYMPNIRMPIGPVAEILEVKAISGIYTITLLADEYIWEDEVIKLRNLPLYDHLVIEYIAGYPDQSQIPASIKQGMLLHIAEMYDSRGMVASISREVQKLYQLHRKMML
ncbi:MAG: head-tail connector protein [Pseudomonadota bacterium]